MIHSIKLGQKQISCTASLNNRRSSDQYSSSGLILLRGEIMRWPKENVLWTFLAKRRDGALAKMIKPLYYNSVAGFYLIIILIIHFNDHNV